MLPSDYQGLASKTIVDLGDDNFRGHLLNSAVGMSCEAGEVLQSIQRSIFCGKPLDTDHIVEECGDVLWYISYLLTTLNVSLNDCMILSLNKCYDRYPNRVIDQHVLDYVHKLKETNLTKKN